jgi:hypothetical protein
MSIIRKLYQSAVPGPVREKIWHWRHGLPRRLHDLRWSLASRRHLELWTEHRLRLDKSYWLFILGCNNSGTTLLNRLLATHPNIRSLPKEGHALTRGLPNATEMGVSRVFSERLDAFRWTEENDPTPAARIKYDWAYYYDPRPGALLEKTPTNSLRSRWLQENFRPARFVTIVRSPYAVCEGIRRRKGHTIEQAARHWNRVHQILLEDMPLLEECLWLRYEDLCIDLENQLRRLEQFLKLELPFDRNLRSYEIQMHNIEERPQPIRNFNQSSMERLTADDVATITRITADAMRRFDYEPELACAVP